MTKGEITTLYFNMRDIEHEMLKIGKKMVELSTIGEPCWDSKGTQLIGASGIVAGWILQLEKEYKFLEFKQ